MCKFEIAFIVRRDCHHGAFAVTDEDVIRDPYRQLFAGQRMFDEQAGGHSLLFSGRYVGFRYAAHLAFLDESLQGRVVLCCLGRQGMFCRNRNIRSAHQGIRTGGIDF